jgi:hypothetical protein
MCKNKNKDSPCSVQVSAQGNNPVVLEHCPGGDLLGMLQEQH